MKMKDVCQQTGISRRNIHFYIQEGLLAPSVNPGNGYYAFSEEDCRRLLFIRQMRNAGMSIQAIQAILTDPVTAEFYVNQQIKKLKKEQRHLEQTLISLQYILDDLSFYPDYAELYEITSAAGIPEPDNSEDGSEFDRYSTAIINRFLWGGFLPKTKWTEYQEFLWMKINRLTAENPPKDYTKLAGTLFSMTPEQINKLFDMNVDRYRSIVALNADTVNEFKEDMIIRLRTIVNKPKYVQFWKEIYDRFFQPITNIQASELSLLVMELCPFYKDYVSNIVAVCGKVYDYLTSDAGQELYQNITAAFGDSINIDESNHGQLEALISVPILYEIKTLRK